MAYSHCQHVFEYSSPCSTHATDPAETFLMEVQAVVYCTLGSSLPQDEQRKGRHARFFRRQSQPATPPWPWITPTAPTQSAAPMAQPDNRATIDLRSINVDNPAAAQSASG